MKTLQTTLAACGLVASLAACGDDKANTPTDTSTTTDTTTTTDATTATDTGSDTSAPTCDLTGITVVQQSLEYDAEADETYYEGQTAGTTTVDAVLIQFYPPLEGGGASPLTGPGTYPIGARAVDQDFASCETCVLILDDCDEEGCAKIFFATSGTINVTALDQDNLVMQGTLTDAVLVEVDIDDETSASTPVADGDTWCLPSFAFDSTPECTKNADCTESGKNICDLDTLTCVGCTSSFQCTAATPVCAVDTLTCVAGVDECTSDDAFEPNDGPAAATAVTLGEAKAAAVCSGETDQERDWFKFTSTGEKNLSAKITWSNTDASMFVVLFNASNTIVGAVGESGPGVDEQFFALAPAGDYYAVVVPSDTSDIGGGAVAVAYSLTITATAPECSATVACAAGDRPVCDLAKGACVACVDSFDCTSATPACVVTEDVAACAKVDLCTGDDETDADDGPSAATTITLGAAATSAKICGDNEAPTAGESDWYKFVLASSTPVLVTVTWEGASDLDVAVYKEDGTFVDEGLIDQPEALALELTAGTYYAQVVSYADNATAAIAYTVKLEEVQP